MARPRKSLKLDSTLPLPAPRVRHVLNGQLSYLPKKCNGELSEWIPALVDMQGQVVPPVLLSPIEEYQLTNGEAILNFSFHYIIKNKWNKNHPLPPYSNQIKSLLSRFANTWLCTLELCVQCRDFLCEQELQELPRASDWFKQIVKEHRANGLKTICSNHQAYLEKQTHPHVEPKQPSKHDIVPEMRAFLKKLKRFENPHSQQEEPRMHRLIDIASTLAQGQTTSFRKKYWNPYIKSIEKQIELIENDNRIGVIQERNGYPTAHSSTRAVTPLGNHLFLPFQNGGS